MKFGFMSEILVLSGLYLFVSSYMIPAIVLFTIGCIAGSVRFFYNISYRNNSLDFKILVYADIKDFIKNVLFGEKKNEVVERKYTIH